MLDEYVRVTNEAGIISGEMKGYKINGREILVVNYNGVFYAVDGKCPHMGGDLSKGVLEENVIVCPKHHSRFDVTNGKAISGPKIFLLNLKVKDLKSYPVKLEDGEIRVKI